MTLPTQQIMGLASGMDTAGIIEQLMSIERNGATGTGGVAKLQNKLVEEQTKLQAYQAINTLFSNVKLRTNSLVKSDVWSGKTAVSSAQEILQATANSMAAPGSYTFRVGRLADTAQYTSAAFASATTAVAPYTENGYVTIDSSKARVDTTTSVANLNGGKGIFAGSIRIVDRDGGAAVVDLSVAETIEDVLRSINYAAGANVHARLNTEADGLGAAGTRIVVEDQSGGAGTMKIQNYGGSTTATDLGLAGASTSGDGSSLLGASIWKMGNSTQLSSLNDGLGVERGNITLTVIEDPYSPDGSAVASVTIDLSQAKTVQDVIDQANRQIAARVAEGHELLDGARLQLNAAGNGFELTGLKDDGRSYSISSDGDKTTAADLGLEINNVRFKTSHAGADILGAMDSPKLKNLAGAQGNGLGLAAAHTLFESEMPLSLLATGDLFTADAFGADAMKLTFTIPASGDTAARTMEFTVDLSAAGFDETTSFKDLVTEINNQLATQASDGNAVLFDADGEGLLVLRQGELLTGGGAFKIEGALADALGLAMDVAAGNRVDMVAGASIAPEQVDFPNVGAITDATRLGDLNQGAGFELGEITFAFDNALTDDARTITIDTSTFSLTENSTVGDFLAALNAKLATELAGDAYFTGVALTVGISADDPTRFAVTGTKPDEVGLIQIDGVTGRYMGLEQARAMPYSGTTVVSSGGSAGPVAPERGLGRFTATDQNGDLTQFDLSYATTGLTQDSTLNDLLAALNAQAAGTGLTFVVNSAANGIAVENNGSNTYTFSNYAYVDDTDPLNPVTVATWDDTLAADLGLMGKTVTAGGYTNAGDLDRRYLSRATELSTLNGGQGVPQGSFGIIGPQGWTFQVDIPSTAKTLGDAIDVINSSVSGLRARINDTGDGIVIEQTGDDMSGDDVITGEIRIEEIGGTTAQALGLTGTGTGGARGLSSIDGSFEKTILVTNTDSLQDLMFRIDESGASVYTSVVNDGTGYRLVVKSDYSGGAGDFILDTNVDALGFNRSGKGQDAILLYGGGEGAAPTVLKSSTNTNNSAILGLTLDLQQASLNQTVTVNVRQDTETAKQELLALVDAYNSMFDLVQQLDYYDTSTGEKGLLWGDSSVRSMMDSLSETFYSVYYPNGQPEKTSYWTQDPYQDYADVLVTTYNGTTFFDLGITFDDDGRLTVDTATLDDAFANDYDNVHGLLAQSKNVAAKSVDAFASFTGDALDSQHGLDNVIDGNSMSSGNAFVASKTIAEGANQMYISFNGSKTLSSLALYHANSVYEPSAQYALRDFIVEYLDEMGEWQEARKVEGNTASATYITLPEPTKTSQIRITATSTNAADGRFRLLEVEAYENQGLVGEMDRLVNSLSDSVNGWFTQVETSVNDAIADLQETIAKQEERLVEIEARYLRQFTAMEVALSQLTTQGDYFTQQMTAWNNANSS